MPSSSCDPSPVSAPGALRQTLIAAALQILAERDTGLDLRKVAERAGKSRTAPYLVFGKERDGGGLRGLRMAVAAEGLRMLLVELSERAGSRGDPLLNLQKTVCSIYQFAADRPRLFALMHASESLKTTNTPLDGRAVSPEKERLLTLRREVEDVMRQDIRELRQCGLVGLSETGATKALGEQILGHTAMLTFDRIQDDASCLESAGVAVASVVGFSPGALELTARSFLETRGVWNPSTGLRREAEPQVAEAADGRSEESRLTRLFRGIRRVGPAATREPPEPSVKLVPPMSSVELTRVVTEFSGLRRAARGRGEIEGKRVLWIAEELEGSAPEVSTLRSLGLTVDLALFSESLEVPVGPGGSRLLTLIVLDMKSGDGTGRGVIPSPKALEAAGPEVAIVLYGPNGSALRTHPPGVRGVAPQMNELLHLLMDVLGGR